MADEPLTHTITPISSDPLKTVLDWFRNNRHDFTEEHHRAAKQWTENPAVALLIQTAFHAGREFQRRHPTYERTFHFMYLKNQSRIVLHYEEGKLAGMGMYSNKQSPNDGMQFKQPGKTWEQQFIFLVESFATDGRDVERAKEFLVSLPM